MTDTTLSVETAPTPATCSQNREQPRGLPIDMLRMVGLDVAGQLLGKNHLAARLGISVRALNYKMNAERGVGDEDVLWAAVALEERAERVLSHARKLRSLLPAPDAQLLTAAAQAAAVIAWCDHVERFAYERQGAGQDASPHLLAQVARTLATTFLPTGGAQG